MAEVHKKNLPELAKKTIMLMTLSISAVLQSSISPVSDPSLNMVARSPICLISSMR